MRKEKYQQLGTKTKYTLFLGNRRTNDFLERLEDNAESYYIDKLREAYENTEIVQNVEFTTEEKIILELLKGNTNKFILKSEQVKNNNLILVFEDKENEYIICINRYKKSYIINKKINQEIETIYNTVQEHTNLLSNNIDIKLNQRKNIVVGSFGLSSVLAEQIADKYNLQHIAFNPVLLKCSARIFKIRGDPLSLFAFNNKKGECFEIVKSYSVLTNNANALSNF